MHRCDQKINITFNRDKKSGKQNINEKEQEQEKMLFCTV